MAAVHRRDRDPVPLVDPQKRGRKVLGLGDGAEEAAVERLGRQAAEQPRDLVAVRRLERHQARTIRGCRFDLDQNLSWKEIARSVVQSQ